MMDIGDTNVLFLADLGIEGGNKLLEKYKGTGYLKADIVQMSHHGQKGVSEDVYKEVSPRVDLWRTPYWLWNNQPIGQEFNTGSWDTLNVRKYMKDLNVNSIVGYGEIKEIRIDV
jgi:hypothetical protein